MRTNYLQWLSFGLALPTTSAVKVILDNDWSTAGFIPYLLALDQGWEVLGLVGDTANSWALQTSLHGLATLEVGNLSSCIPVYKGADYPFINTPELIQAWQELFGILPWQGVFKPMNATAEATGSDPTSGDPNRIAKSAFLEGYPNGALSGYHAAAWMVEQVHKYPGEVMIYSGGSLTNIAMAIRMDSKFASLSKGLVLMGGYLDVNLLQTSGSTLQADINFDLNFITDPIAGKIALQADFPNITIVGNAANQIFPTQDLLDDIYKVKNPYTELVYRYYGTTLPFWDEIAIFSVLDHKNVKNSTSFYVDIDTSYFSPMYGRIYGYQEALMPSRQVLRKVNMIVQVDEKKFKTQLKRALQHPVSCKSLR